MKIDVHAHYWTSEYLDMVQALGKADTAAQRDKGAGGGPEMAARLKVMDRAGIDMQILSACPQMPYSADEASALRVARYVNDQYAAVVNAHPTRFRAFASLPLPHIEASLAEMRRALDDLGMVGVCANTTVLDEPLVSSRFSPLFDELNRRGSVLYIHPSGNGCCSPLINNYNMTWQIGAPTEDTISVMQLITHGFPIRYPGIRIINSHLGGAMPMLMQRVDNQYQSEAPETPDLPSRIARKMWYDTVGHGHVPALKAAIDTFGADRLLLGSDFPYENGDLLVRAVRYICDETINPDDARAILEENAHRLFDFAH